MEGKSVLILSHAPRIIPRVMNQIDALNRTGVSTTFMCWKRERRCESREINWKVEQVYLPAPKGKGLLLLWFPLLWLSMFRKAIRYSFNVVHCTHLGLLPLAVSLGKLRNAKIVYDDYDFDSFRMMEILPPLLKPLGRALVWVINKGFLRHVDHVFVIDTAGDTLWRHYRQYTPGVTSLANYPSINDVRLGTPRVVNDYRNKRGASKTLVYVGGIDVFKGSRVMLEALNLVRNKIPDVNLLMIGDFSDQDQEQLVMDIARKYKLGGHVRIFKWLPYDEMINYVKTSQVGMALYQPIERYRLSRGNARKIYTYMSCGIPVIGPNFGEIAAVVVKEDCGLTVDASDPNEVAGAIQFLLSRPEDIERLGQNGLRAVAKRYNWENESKKFISVYASLMR